MITKKITVRQEELPIETMSTMGCVDGNEIITYKYRGELYVESFERMWQRTSEYANVCRQIPDTDDHLFFDADDMQIFDMKHGFVDVKRVVRNLSTQWVNIVSSGRTLTCTVDHPLPVGEERIRADQIVPGSHSLTANMTQYTESTLAFDSERAWLLGVILCDGCYDNHVVVSIAADTEDDIQDVYISGMKRQFGVDVKVVERRRGKAGYYKDLVCVGSVTKLIDYLTSKYQGLTKIRRHIPNEVFSWNRDAKMSFLAGMIDADGYINNVRNGGSVVQIGSTNKELALQQMALAQSLGMRAKVYINHYTRRNPDAIRYRIEFIPTNELVARIVSQKKRDNYVPGDQIWGSESAVMSVKPFESTMYSYDVETSSDYFDVSGILSHNCRTQNGADVNAKDSFARNIRAVINGEDIVDDFRSGAQKDGRGNICPVTIIMPTLAMECKVDFDDDVKGHHSFDDDNILIGRFLDKLDRKIQEAKDMLLERFEWICSQPAESATFMYENHVMAGYVPEEGIRSALKHGTLAIGQIGLAETLQILIGCDHTEPEGMKLAKRIEQLFKNRCAEFKEQYKLNFGVYYSPAENLCYTAMKRFKAKYGEIPNVSDKDFFTNSIHVPVWKQVTPFEKIDIESQLTGYSNAGCITYVELDSSCQNNIDGLESLVNYAMDHDIPYFAINVPNDQCMVCGYCGDMDDTCPKCGSTNIKRLRRVTGYLTNDYKTAFNRGKQQEVEMRTKHNQVEEI